MRRVSRFFVGSAAALCLCAQLASVADPGGHLYVVNSLSRDISVIDADANRVAGSISVGCEPYHVALSPDGKRAYATCQEGVATLDLAKRRMLSRTPMTLSPMATVHVHPSGKRVFVVSAGPTGKRNQERGTLYALEAPSLKTKWHARVGLNPLCSVMAPAGDRLFVANWGSRDVSVIDLAAGRLLDSVPLDQRSGVRALVVTSDGKAVYAPQGEAGALWEIGVRSLKRVHRPFSAVSHVYSAALSPDDRYLYLHGHHGGSKLAVVRVDLRDLKKLKPLGDHRLSAMATSHDGKLLYLTGTPGDTRAEMALNDRLQHQMQNAPVQSRSQQQVTAKNWANELTGLRQTVTVLNTATGKVVAKIPVGSAPVSNRYSPK